MDKLSEVPNYSEHKTIAFVMFITGLVIWFLIDSSKPLAHDLMKAIGFFLFGYGLISLSKWTRWSELSSKEKNMRIIFFIIIAVIIIAGILFFVLRK